MFGRVSVQYIFYKESVLKVSIDLYMVFAVLFSGQIDHVWGNTCTHDETIVG